MLENISDKVDSKILKFEEKILKLVASGDKRKASNLIEKHLESKNIIQNKDVLKFVLEPSGMTVAHKMAHLGFSFNDSEILKLTGEDRSHINSIFGHNACSVAFILAKKGFTFTDPSILTLGSENNRTTVAHAMAAKGYTFSEKEILSLKDDKGTTVAHIMATNGHIFSDPEILKLENQFGFTVKDFQKVDSKPAILDI